VVNEALSPGALCLDSFSEGQYNRRRYRTY
jgi:hypothetical protein